MADPLIEYFRQQAAARAGDFTSMSQNGRAYHAAPTRDAATGKMALGNMYTGIYGHNYDSEGNYSQGPLQGYSGSLSGRTKNQAGQIGDYVGRWDAQGNLQDVSFEEMQDGFIGKLLDYAPLLVAAAATAGGAGLLGGYAGAAGASEASLIAAQTAAGGASAGAGAAAGLGAGAAAAAPAAAAPAASPAAGLTGPMSSMQGSGLGGFLESAGMSGTTTGASAAGTSWMPGSLGEFMANAGFGAGATAASMGLTAAQLAAPIAESLPSWQAPTTQAAQKAGTSVLGQIGEYASTAMQGLSALSSVGSLLGASGGQSSQLEQMISQAAGMQQAVEALRPPEAPPVPGANAPAEARGYQSATNPILDVLGRNRQQNRNRTMLTGPGGVNMDAVRVGGNTLLGL